jgi:hypothetical protein
LLIGRLQQCAMERFAKRIDCGSIQPAVGLPGESVRNAILRIDATTKTATLPRQGVVRRAEPADP